MSTKTSYAKLYSIFYALLVLAAFSPAPIKNRVRQIYTPESSQAIREQQQAVEPTRALIGSEQTIMREMRGPEHNSGDAAQALVSTSPMNMAKAENAIRQASEEVQQPVRTWINSFFMLLFSLALPLGAIAGLRRLLDRRIPTPPRRAKSGW